MSALMPSLFKGLEEEPISGERALRLDKTGILPAQAIRTLIDVEEIRAAPRIDPTQVQPASLDLRLGRVAYRVRASFLPGPKCSVKQKLQDLSYHQIDLRQGAVLESGFVYVVPLIESLALRSTISGFANPKSSTGRLDIFTRLIADNCSSFDYVPEGYEGGLFAEICPRAFSIFAKMGSSLNQLRFRRRIPHRQEENTGRVRDRELRDLRPQLAEGDATVSRGLNLSVDLSKRTRSGVVGYKAKRYAPVLDLDKVGFYKVGDFWDEIYSEGDGRLVLDPREFYILASKENVTVPPDYVAEMAPFDPTIGEYRVHYAGFFDPGFGYSPESPAGAKAVLEVRSLDIPFILEDGQKVGRLKYEKLIAPADTLYGQGTGSHYQAQGLKLSKHFKQE